MSVLSFLILVFYRDELSSSLEVNSLDIDINTSYSESFAGDVIKLELLNHDLDSSVMSFLSGDLGESERFDAYVNDLQEALSGLIKISTTSTPLSESVKNKVQSMSERINEKIEDYEKFVATLKSYQVADVTLSILKNSVLKEAELQVKNYDALMFAIDTSYNSVQQVKASNDTLRVSVTLASLDRSEKKLITNYPNLNSIYEFFEQARDVVSYKAKVNELKNKFLKQQEQLIFSDLVEEITKHSLRVNVVEPIKQSKPISLLGIISLVCVSLISVVFVGSRIFNGKHLSFFPLKLVDLSLESSAKFDPTYKDNSHAKVTFPEESKSLIASNVAVADNSKVSENNNVQNMEEFASVFSHKVNVPLDFMGENIKSLSDVLEEVHDIFTSLEAEREKQNIPDLLSARIESSSVYELPFTIANILEGLKCTKDIVENMKNMSQRKRLSPPDIDLNTIVYSVLDMKEIKIDPIVNLKLKLSSDPALINIPASDIRNIVDSLISNSLEAIESRNNINGVVEVTTAVRGGTVKLVVRDNGIGIPCENIKKVYDPFFTTKKEDQFSAGFGLTLARRTIERFGGTIEIARNPDSGVIVRVSLPGKNKTANRKNVSTRRDVLTVTSSQVKEFRSFSSITELPNNNSSMSNHKKPINVVPLSDKDKVAGD